MASCGAFRGSSTKMGVPVSPLTVFLSIQAVALLVAALVLSRLTPSSAIISPPTPGEVPIILANSPQPPPPPPPPSLANYNWSQPHHRKNKVNFEQLLTRILNYIGAPVSPVQQQYGLVKLPDPLKVAADVNNRTSMRFLQNNKTFASIVYTDDFQRPRKLISCHLLDLEKHTPEVGQLEAKHNLRTVLIEFRDMMQLIDCCTDIERTKPRSRLSIGLAALRALVRRSHQNRQPTNKQHLILPASTKINEPASIRKRLFSSMNEQRSSRSDIVHHLDHSMEAGGHRLVLGEVTAPPEVKDKHSGGFVEALQEISSFDSSDLISIWRGILPGTNWCGMGDRASSYDHLGFEVDVDICCRAHDFCPIRLSAFSGGYGLFNWSFYTRSHCWCDQNFLECLLEANSSLAAVVTRFYFSIMRTTCLHDNETIQEPPNQQQQQPPFVDGYLKVEDTAALPAWQMLPLRHQQQRPLLDQIRAAAPIPAQVRSQPVRARIDAAPNSQLKIHPKDQIRVMPGVSG